MRVHLFPIIGLAVLFLIGEFYGTWRDLLVLAAGALGPYLMKMLARWYEGRLERLKAKDLTQSETFHDTVEWMISERKEMYLESENTYKGWIERLEKEINRLVLENDQLRERLRQRDLKE